MIVCKRYKKYYLKLLILLVSCFPSIWIFSRTISRTEIETSGIKRLTEIFYFVDQWQTFTLDGYHWYASPNSLALNQDQQWRVMINGHLYDTNILGMNHINLIPIQIEQIDSIKIIQTPSIYHGQNTTEGIIHLFSSQTKQKKLNLQYTMGNQSGDPGPYQYTPLQSENVDRLGPDYSTLLSMKKNKFDGQFQYHFNQHTFTNPNMIQGLESKPWHFKRALTYKVGFSLNRRTKRSTHNMIIGFTKVGHDPLTQKQGHDLLYYPSFDQKIPSKVDLFNIGANGTLFFSEHLNFHYRFYSNQKSIKSIERSLYKTLDIHNAQQRINLEIWVHTQLGDYTCGISHGRTELYGKNIFNKVNSRNQIYGELKTNCLTNWNPVFYTFLTISGKPVTNQFGIQSLKRISHKVDMRTTFAYSQYLPEEYTWDNIDYNQDALYAWGKRDSLVYEKNIQWIQNWKIQYNKKLTMELKYSYQQTFGTSLYPTYPGFWKGNLGKMAEGNFVQGYIGTCYHPKEQIQLSGFYMYQNTIDGNVEYKDMVSIIPKYKWGLKLMLRPTYDLSVWGQFRYGSVSNWRIGNEIKNRPYNDVKSIPSLDFTITKYLWKHRAKIGLKLKNLLNKPIRYHPEGAYFRFSMLMNFSLTFSSNLE